MDSSDITNRFTYHPATPAQAKLYEEIRAKALEFSLFINFVTPSSREQSQAITCIDDACKHAISAIARHSPPQPIENKNFPPEILGDSQIPT